jgi:hypothetical protein
MIKVILKGFVITFIFIRCANPVGPTGGDKDEKSPIIKNVKIETINQEKNISITFDENINTKGEITISPYTHKQNISLNTYRNILNFTVPSNTNSISLNDVITDVNENNAGKYPFIILGTDSLNYIIKYESPNPQKDKIKGYFKIDSFYYPGDNSEKGIIKFGGLKNIDNQITLFNDNNNNNLYDQEEDYYIQQIKLNQLYKDSIKDTTSLSLYPPLKREIKRGLNRQDSLAIYIGIPKSIIDTIFNQEKIYIVNHIDTTVINIQDTSDIEKLFKANNLNFKINQSKIDLTNTGNIKYKISLNEKDTLIRIEKTIGYILNKLKQRKYYFYSKKEVQQYKLYNTLEYSSIYRNPFERNIEIETKSYINSKKDTFYKSIKYKIGQLNIKLKDKEIDNLKIKLINSKNYVQVFSLKKELNILLDQDTYHYYIWEDSNNNNEMDIYKENEVYIAEKIKIYNKETAVNSKLENTITVE